MAADGKTLNPLARQPVDKPLDVGVGYQFDADRWYGSADWYYRRFLLANLFCWDDEPLYDGRYCCRGDDW